jgi:hypothetical protein
LQVCIVEVVKCFDSEKRREILMMSPKPSQCPHFEGSEEDTVISERDGFCRTVDETDEILWINSPQDSPVHWVFAKLECDTEAGIDTHCSTLALLFKKKHSCEVKTRSLFLTS